MRTKGWGGGGGKDTKFSAYEIFWIYSNSKKSGHAGSKFQPLTKGIDSRVWHTLPLYCEVHLQVFGAVHDPPF